MSYPNIFNWATSELSQDAMICWLLAWAAPEHGNQDPELHKCGQRLIRAFFAKHGKHSPDLIEKVEVRKQDRRIDVLCIINDTYPILIEDKTGTQHHSNQLVRYLENVRGRHYKEENILPIYFKTGEQSHYRGVIDSGYQPFLRADILGVLEGYDGHNQILINYRDYLRAITARIESYSTLAPEHWHRDAWTGFYLQLKKELNAGNWGYVANRSGGFLGYWWCFQKDDDCTQYLQLEEQKLCFKISVDDPKNRRALRTKWYKRIQRQAEKVGLRVRKPGQFGNGQFMTVGICEDCRITDKGVLDLASTISRLREAEAILQKTALE
tara:strand:+ start:5238 stop:6212 length:975 start_codon:yes stop_codon:yes gene_type:complete